MGSFSLWHWLVVLVVILLVFGAGKIPRLASDMAQGIKNFRKGMAEGDADAERPKVTEAKAAGGANDTAASKDKAAQG
jgi:sec-independent protein translocase protein TatA